MDRGERPRVHSTNRHERGKVKRAEIKRDCRTESAGVIDIVFRLSLSLYLEIASPRAITAHSRVYARFHRRCSRNQASDPVSSSINTKRLHFGRVTNRWTPNCWRRTNARDSSPDSSMLCSRLRSQILFHRIGTRRGNRGRQGILANAPSLSVAKRRGGEGTRASRQGLRPLTHLSTSIPR